MARQLPPPALICINCGDELVIAAAFTLRGPVCADCAPADAPASKNPPNHQAEKLNMVEQSSPRSENKAGAKREDAREATEIYAAASDTRAFHPAPRAQELAIEIEEWIYQEHRVISTPVDLMVDRVHAPRAGTRYSRFMVVLEWSRDGGPTMRDIGPGFGTGITDRQAALAEATVFARFEAKRLKACGPFGYKPARDIPEVRHGEDHAA